MKIFDVRYHPSPVPCDTCYKASEWELYVSHASNEYILYLCPDHIGDSEAKEFALEKLRDRIYSDPVIIEGLIFNTRFKAYYDKYDDILHILDLRKEDNYMELEIGVDRILSHLEYDFRLVDTEYRIFLYGSDKMVTEYFESSGEFQVICEYSDLIFKPFLQEMKEIYK